MSGAQPPAAEPPLRTKSAENRPQGGLGLRPGPAPFAGYPP